MDFNLPPEEYLKKINDIEIRTNLILDELKNTYVNYKLYPDVSEYQNIYLNNKQNIDNARNDIFLLKNYLQSNLSNQKIEIKSKGKIIDDLKKENLELNNRYKSLLSGNNAAIGLNHQQDGLYSLSKYSITLSIIGIICISFVTVQAFNSKSNKIKSIVNNIPIIGNLNSDSTSGPDSSSSNQSQPLTTAPK